MSPDYRTGPTNVLLATLKVPLSEWKNTLIKRPEDK